MAKSLLKKAKKAAKKVKKEVKKEVKSTSSSTKSKVSIRAHVEKHAREMINGEGDRRDCEVINRLLMDTEKYKTDEDIINLIKLKGYDTLLGEVS